MASSRTLTFTVTKLRAAVVTRYDEAIAQAEKDCDADAVAAKHEAKVARWREDARSKIRRAYRNLKTMSDSELDRFHLGYLPGGGSVGNNDLNRLDRLREQRERALRLIDALHVAEGGAVDLTATQAKEFLGVDL